MIRNLETDQGNKTGDLCVHKFTDSLRCGFMILSGFCIYEYSYISAVRINSRYSIGIISLSHFVGFGPSSLQLSFLMVLFLAFACLTSLLIRQFSTYCASSSLYYPFIFVMSENDYTIWTWIAPSIIILQISLELWQIKRNAGRNRGETSWCFLKFKVSTRRTIKLQDLTTNLQPMGNSETQWMVVLNRDTPH